MTGRRFKILSIALYDPRFPKSPKPHGVGNGTEMIEVVKDTEMGETIWREIPPSIIKEPKNDLERAYNEYAKICGTIVRDDALLYKLLEEGKIVLE